MRKNRARAMLNAQVGARGTQLGILEGQGLTGFATILLLFVYYYYLLVNTQ